MAHIWVCTLLSEDCISIWKLMYPMSLPYSKEVMFEQQDFISISNLDVFVLDIKNTCEDNALNCTERCYFWWVECIGNVCTILRCTINRLTLRLICKNLLSLWWNDASCGPICCNISHIHPSLPPICQAMDFEVLSD